MASKSSEIFMRGLQEKKLLNFDNTQIYGRMRSHIHFIIFAQWFLITFITRKKEMYTVCLTSYRTFCRNVSKNIGKFPLHLSSRPSSYKVVFSPPLGSTGAASQNGSPVHFSDMRHIDQPDQVGHAYTAMLLCL